MKRTWKQNLYLAKWAAESSNPLFTSFILHPSKLTPSPPSSWPMILSTHLMLSCLGHRHCLPVSQKPHQFKSFLLSDDYIKGEKKDTQLGARLNQVGQALLSVRLWESVRPNSCAWTGPDLLVSEHLRPPALTGAPPRQVGKLTVSCVRALLAATLLRPQEKLWGLAVHLGVRGLKENRLSLSPWWPRVLEKLWVCGSSAGCCGIPGFFQNPDPGILKNLNPGFFGISRSP